MVGFYVPSALRRLRLIPQTLHQGQQAGQEQPGEEQREQDGD
jgi:hypothetical protein